ncbi:transposase [Streptomyces sp. PSKA54]|uniref:Transposase n=1 Tax=Streptomyces himalayensis subsp. aureolus TaxID=2758039 RepID=A0A7W2D654_9ACTN|nr:transposase [Streptomyces himalayensis subsp. aureolus]
MAISRQNNRSTSRRSDGFPGDFIAALPVNAFFHPAGLPINTSKIEVLRRPVESAQYTSREFAELCAQLGVRQSMGAVGTSAENALAESFNAALKRETLRGARRFDGHRACRLAVFRWTTRYNTRRRHSANGQLAPIAYEQQSATLTLAA